MISRAARNARSPTIRKEKERDSTGDRSVLPQALSFLFLRIGSSLGLRPELCSNPWTGKIVFGIKRFHSSYNDGPPAAPTHHERGMVSLLIGSTAETTCRFLVVSLSVVLPPKTSCSPFLRSQPSASRRACVKEGEHVSWANCKPKTRHCHMCAAPMMTGRVL